MGDEDEDDAKTPMPKVSVKPSFNIITKGGLATKEQLLETKGDKKQKPVKMGKTQQN